jgi:hypothetical protein
MKPRIAVPLVSAVFTAAVATLLVATTRIDVAEQAAQCMEETHDLQACSRPAGGALSLWDCVAVFAVVGSIVGAAGYSVGSRRA